MDRYFREGKIKEVADYCETDVVGTYQLWLRYGLCCLVHMEMGGLGPGPPSTTRSECYPCPLPTNHGHRGTVAEFIPTA